MPPLSRRLVLLLVLLSALACGRRPAAENVILIVVDTLRADHLSLYGYPRATSPLLEVWARRGLVFEQALAPSPWTLPTFGSILTGLAPQRHAAGRRFESGEKKWRRSPLTAEVRTLPEILQQRGFRTGAIVSNPFLRPHFGAARGFGDYDYEKGRRADVAVDRTLEWLADRGEQRFFLMLHLIDPHLPYGPPKSVRGRFADQTAPDFVPRGRKNLISMLADMTDADRASIVGRYDEEIAFVDEELDRLFRFLEQEGLWESTLVILTADHGEELFDHGGFEHGHSMFQEVLRVPLVIWHPQVESGRQVEPVSLIDLTPTILSATAVDTETPIEGASLWQAMRERRGPPRRELLAENTLWGREKKSLVAWPYKLILDPSTGQRELYDLEVDPLERQDLAPKRGELAAALAARLDRALRSDAEPLPDSELVLSEEMEEELRALGYLD